MSSSVSLSNYLNPRPTTPYWDACFGNCWLCFPHFMIMYLVHHLFIFVSKRFFSNWAFDTAKIPYFHFVLPHPSRISYLFQYLSILYPFVLKEIGLEGKVKELTCTCHIKRSAAINVLQIHISFFCRRREQRAFASIITRGTKRTPFLLICNTGSFSPA